MELNSKKRISINVISSVLQVGSVGIIYLIVYRILLDKIGIEQLGIWSLILASTSVANLANFGITSGIVKFVAEYFSKNQIKKIEKVVFTSFFSLTIFFILISLIIYPLSKYFLKHVVDIKYYELALKIVPISLSSLVISSTSGVFTSVLEGIQKNYIKNFLVTTSSIVFLIGVIFLTDKYGLEGVAYSQLLQSTFLFLISYLFVAFEFKSFLILFSNWSKEIFKQIMGFSLKFQLISMLVLFFDPITKAFLGKFGGLTFLGYYEMANKLVYQVRALVVNANQVMIPVLIHSVHSKIDNAKNLYNTNLKLTFLISLLLMGSLVILTPLISFLWIGELKSEFIYSVPLLTLGVFINLVSSPAYFASIADGDLKILLKTHIILTLFNVFLGYLLGSLFEGGFIIVFTSTFALVISSAFLIFNFSKKIKKKKILSLNNIISFIIAIFLCIISFFCMNWILKSKIELVHVILTTIIVLAFFYFILLRIDRKLIKKIF